MTIRKIWLGILCLVAVVAIIINTVVLSSLTDRYFKDYLNDNYDTHINQIIDLSRQIVTAGDYTQKQIELQFETHLIDPIVLIELFDPSGNLMASAGENIEQYRMMGGRMMPMMGDYSDDDRIFETMEILEDGKVAAYLKVTSYSTVGKSIETRLFKANLIRNSLISMGVVIIIAVLTGFFISRRMSRDLMSTARLAQDISLGNPVDIEDTKIKEIRIIRQNLESLRDRLRLRNRSRKIMTDSLIHQTRTPLTVLKTHIEGISDGMVELTGKEAEILLQQVDDITDMISGLSEMIDAKNDFDEVSVEEFNPGDLIDKIVNSLKMQFDNKNISLGYLNNLKFMIKSDRNKLGQAVYNLLTNAYKFTDENGSVIIESESDNEFLIIRVNDTGIGMTADQADKAFDAYYKSDTEKEGDGLGLFIAKENISKMNGEIWVESEYGKGSSFIIKIPKNIDDA